MSLAKLRRELMASGKKSFAVFCRAERSEFGNRCCRFSKKSDKELYNLGSRFTISVMLTTIWGMI